VTLDAEQARQAVRGTPPFSPDLDLIGDLERSTYTRCATCGRTFRRSLGRGRPRSHCPECAPPGTKHPRMSFPAVSRTLRKRARNAARAAAAREVASAHFAEYWEAYQRQLAKRGIQ
jgi:recombinational DNA repair protein (RecF pathway)